MTKRNNYHYQSEDRNWNGGYWGNYSIYGNYMNYGNDEEYYQNMYHDFYNNYESGVIASTPTVEKARSIDYTSFVKDFVDLSQPTILRDKTKIPYSFRFPNSEREKSFMSTALISKNPCKSYELFNKNRPKNAPKIDCIVSSGYTRCVLCFLLRISNNLCQAEYPWDEKEIVDRQNSTNTPGIKIPEKSSPVQEKTDSTSPRTPKRVRWSPETPYEKDGKSNSEVNSVEGKNEPDCKDSPKISLESKCCELKEPEIHKSFSTDVQVDRFVKEDVPKLQHHLKMEEEEEVASKIDVKDCKIEYKIVEQNSEGGKHADSMQWKEQVEEIKKEIWTKEGCFHKLQQENEGLQKRIEELKKEKFEFDRILQVQKSQYEQKIQAERFQYGKKIEDLQENEKYIMDQLYIKESRIMELETNLGS